MTKSIILLWLWLCMVNLVCGQKVEIIDLQTYQSLVSKENDSLYVVNFWATWCVPCVKELPDFLEVEKELIDEKLRFIFISLNHKKEFNKTEVFVKRLGMSFPTYLMDAGNPNDWIDAVEKEWSGSIPFTIFYYKGKNVFFREGEWRKEALLSEIKKTLTKN